MYKGTEYITDVASIHLGKDGLFIKWSRRTQVFPFGRNADSLP